MTGTPHTRAWERGWGEWHARSATRRQRDAERLDRAAKLGGERKRGINTLVSKEKTVFLIAHSPPLIQKL